MTSNRRSEPQWTLEQATQLVHEQMLSLLDGCDDEDTVRTAMAWEAIHFAWSPKTAFEPLPEGMTAGEVRANIRRALARLAQGARHG